MSKDISPYKLGYSAFFNGVGTNPYSPQAEKHQYTEWRNGWDAALDKAWRMHDNAIETAAREAS